MTDLELLLLIKALASLPPAVPGLRGGGRVGRCGLCVWGGGGSAVAEVWAPRQDGACRYWLCTASAHRSWAVVRMMMMT